MPAAGGGRREPHWNRPRGRDHRGWEGAAYAPCRARRDRVYGRRLDHQRGGRGARPEGGPGRLRDHQGVRCDDRPRQLIAMVRLNEVRRGELAIDLPARADAEVYFIGRVRTPWTDRLSCPRQGRADGPTCRIEVFAPWDKGLDSIAQFARLEVLYWLHESRRDLALQAPKSDGNGRGVFSLRTPVRPIGTSLVELVKVEGPVLLVRGLDCL